MSTKRKKKKKIVLFECNMALSIYEKQYAFNSPYKCHQPAWLVFTQTRRKPSFVSSALALSLGGRGFKPRSCQTKDYEMNFPSDAPPSRLAFTGNGEKTG